jgi:hypothetical protein
MSTIDLMEKVLDGLQRLGSTIRNYRNRLIHRQAKSAQYRAYVGQIEALASEIGGESVVAVIELTYDHESGDAQVILALPLDGDRRHAFLDAYCQAPWYHAPFGIQPTIMTGRYYRVAQQSAEAAR